MNKGPGYEKHPNHRVAVVPFQGRVVVEANGEVLADTRDALELQEADYPPVYYVPRGDVRLERLNETPHETYCPFKGTASYFSIADGAENAAWSYETPYDEVLPIRGRLAFYPSKVDTLRIEPADS